MRRREGQACTCEQGLVHKSEGEAGHVHTDVLGPMHQESYEGFRCAIGFLDSYSRYAVMYPMRTRDEVIEKLELFIADVGSPGTLVSHGDSTRCVARMAFGRSTQRPILHRRMAKLSACGALFTGMARCMLETECLLKQLWPYALATSFSVKNRCFHSEHNRTPYEMFFGERPTRKVDSSQTLTNLRGR